MGIVKSSESPQNSKFEMSLEYLKKAVRDEVDFLLFRKINYTLGIKISCKLILPLLMGMIKHFKSTQSNNSVHWRKKLGH